MIYIVLKKELKALYKRKQLLMILAVFAIIGLISPLTALFMPDIMASVLPSEFVYAIPEVTSVDSWTQFFKNTNQIGFVIIFIMFSGIVSNEIEKGTLIPLVTKGLKRSTIILGKYLASLLIWIVGSLLSFGICYLYTLIYFDDDLSFQVIESFACLFIFGCLFLSISLFGSTVTRTLISSLLVSGTIVGLGLLSNLLVKFENYNPFSLVNKNTALIQNLLAATDLLPAVYIACLLTLVFVSLSIFTFNKQAL